MTTFIGDIHGDLVFLKEKIKYHNIKNEIII